MKFEENKMQHDFPKMRGGGQRPFGTFPKAHPICCGHPSPRKEAFFSSFANKDFMLLKQDF